MTRADAGDRGLHVACIMDGNGRWARRRGLPRTEGHTAGEEALAGVVRAAAARNIGWLTVFGFSTENWVRPRTEVRHILSLHRKLFGRVEEMNANNARIGWIGRPFSDRDARTPVYVQRAIHRAIEDTRHNDGLVVTVAFDYGSRAELVRASRLAAASSAGAITDAAGAVTDAAGAITDAAGAVTVDDIASRLYDPSLPPVDLLVRTSGEARISNFMLWQINGARVHFTEKTWPDFDAAELDRALALLDR